MQTSILAVCLLLFLALVSGGHRSEVIDGLPEGALRPPCRLPVWSVFLFLFWGSGVRGHRSEVTFGLPEGLSGPFSDLHVGCFSFSFLALASGVTGVK